jgi:uncharacterized protein (TIGR04255 family)
MRPNLPEYKKPPVVEVALSMQFERLSAMRTHHIGLLWEKYRERFPVIEEHPLLEPDIELFTKQYEGRPRLFVRFSNTPEFPRCWFLNNERTRLIQVQSDRFIYNWRKIEGDEEYPRYEDVRKCFETEFGIFSEFLSKETLGEIKPNQCDVTYVNTIPAENGIVDHSKIAGIIKTISFDYGGDKDLLPLPMEDAEMHVRYVIMGSQNEPAGRLHISIEPLFTSKEGQPVFILKLTARGKPEPADFNGVLEFLDQGRENIVKAFTAWTTSQMHQKWERKQ